MLHWKWKPFKELSLEELYVVLALRQEVFAVEQNCVYQDVDGMDQLGWHLMGWQENDLLAYLRVLPPNSRFAEFCIGRVVVSPKGRRQGYGKELSKEGLKCIEKEFGEVPIRISAQAYLEKFYQDLGFVTDSEEYLEDGIPHVEMMRLNKD